MKSAIDERALVPVKRQADEIERLAGSLVVKNEEQAAEAVSLLSRVKAAQKSIKAKKDAVTKPLNASLKEIRALFAPAESRCTEAEQVIKG